MLKKYNNEEKFILHHVNPVNPCWVCDAKSDTAHANYCPNSDYIKLRTKAGQTK